MASRTETYAGEAELFECAQAVVFFTAGIGKFSNQVHFISTSLHVGQPRAGQTRMFHCLDSKAQTSSDFDVTCHRDCLDCRVSRFQSVHSQERCTPNSVFPIWCLDVRRCLRKYRHTASVVQSSVSHDVYGNVRLWHPPFLSRELSAGSTVQATR